MMHCSPITLSASSNPQGAVHKVSLFSSYTVAKLADVNTVDLKVIDDNPFLQALQSIIQTGIFLIRIGWRRCDLIKMQKKL